MRILLTNDDGIYAQGLLALYHQLSVGHAVKVVAPDRERSGVGHGITLHRPLRAVPVEIRDGHVGHAVNGTPVDCVKLAVAEILESKPDVMISGINPGANVGININYSGTVSAAKEAALYGIPAIAVSMETGAGTDYTEAAEFVEKVALEVVEKGLPQGTLLNINLPGSSLKKVSGIKINRHATTLLNEYFERRLDPRNQAYYWLGCEARRQGGNLDFDEFSLCENYISITPIKCDSTDYGFIESLKDWNILSKA